VIVYKISVVFIEKNPISSNFFVVTVKKAPEVKAGFLNIFYDDKVESYNTSLIKSITVKKEERPDE
jgi:hypothetical protein